MSPQVPAGGPVGSLEAGVHTGPLANTPGSIPCPLACTPVQLRGRVASKMGFFEPTGPVRWTRVHTKYDAR